VADPQNYGNEVLAVQILFPDFWQRYGLEPDEFHKVRDKEELRDLFDSIGSGLKRGKFEAIYNKASTLGGVSIATFVQTMKWFEEQGLN